MKTNRTTEYDVIATFLKAEINSPRWRDCILNVLMHSGQDRRIIDDPDIDNEDQNLSRANILGSYRGYKQNKYLFSHFPDDMLWQKVDLDPAYLQRIRYLKQSPSWAELSGGTLLVADAVRRIKAGIDFSNETKEVLRGILQTLEVLKRGQVLPQVIIVAQSDIHQSVALEGHYRLTAYLLQASNDPISALLGYSVKLSKWEELW